MCWIKYSTWKYHAKGQGQALVTICCGGDKTRYVGARSGTEDHQINVLYLVIQSLHVASESIAKTWDSNSMLT